MRRYALILTVAVLSLALVADASFAQRGGRGGGGGGGGVQAVGLVPPSIVLRP